MPLEGVRLMKFNRNPKYTTVSIYACIVGAAIICCIFLGIYSESTASFFENVFSVFAPIIYGAIIAYLVSPLVNFFEKKVFKKINRRALKRAFSMLLSYTVLFSAVALLLYALIPQLTRSFSDLQNNLIIYANSLQAWVDSVSESSPAFGNILQTVLSNIDLSSLSGSVSQLFSSLSELLSKFSPYIISFVNSFIVQVKNILLGIIFSAYLLASKELVFAQIRKLLHAVLSEKSYSNLSAFIKYTDHTFGRYLLGTFLDSILVGIEVFIALTIFNIPYAPLVSVVCGFTNMIPIFGPFIGAIPSFLIIMIGSPLKALWFLVIIVVIQQIDGNIIAPKIIGESTGLSAIAVISAVTIVGGLFGLVGMVLGVPLFAVFAALIDKKTEEKLAHRAENNEEKYSDTNNGSSKDDTEIKNENTSEGTE